MKHIIDNIAHCKPTYIHRKTGVTLETAKRFHYGWGNLTADKLEAIADGLPNISLSVVFCYYINKRKENKQ